MLGLILSTICYLKLRKVTPSVPICWSLLALFAVPKRLSGSKSNGQKLMSLLFILSFEISIILHKKKNAMMMF